LGQFGGPKSLPYQILPMCRLNDAVPQNNTCLSYLLNSYHFVPFVNHFRLYFHIFNVKKYLTKFVKTFVKTTSLFAWRGSSLASEKPLVILAPSEKNKQN
jgi:hypothetical protein